MTRSNTLKTLLITVSLLLLIAASLLFSNKLSAKPHTANIIGSVSLKINEKMVNYHKANEAIQLEENSIICIIKGKGEVSIDKGVKQLTKPADCAVIKAPQKQGIAKRILNIASYLNPIKPKGEQSRTHGRGDNGQGKRNITIADPYTKPIVFNNKQHYLIINVKQLLETNSQYPLTLRLYSPKRKLIYTISKQQADNILFVFSAEFLRNKNGYRLKISDGLSSVLINSILRINEQSPQE